MYKATIIGLVLLVAGCASTNEFDEYSNHHIRIDNGIFYIREVAAGRVFESSAKVKQDWNLRAAELCNGGFEKMIYQDEEHNYMVTDVETLFLPLVTSASAPRVEGVVRCESSAFNTRQATEVLERELYLLPKKP